jgi:FkbM family methyltransferase
MTFTSYAQNYEDVILWRALKDIPQGFYIDVGSAWPNQDSVTKAFYLNDWHGINIEPNPQLYVLLLESRPNDINLQLAVSDLEGAMELNIFDNTGLSTLDSSIAENQSHENFERHIEIVQVSRLAQICKKYVPNHQDIHFLKVDVEGFEENVLKSNDWQIYRPWIVLVEATRPLVQVESYLDWEHILLDTGYLFAYADGLNRFYVEQSHKELIQKFKYPPNVFDEFILESEKVAYEKIITLEQKIQVLENSMREFEKSFIICNTELRKFTNSRIWRWTFPLRKVIGVFNRLYQKIKLS